MSFDEVVVTNQADVVISAEPDDDILVKTDFEIEVIQVTEQGPPGPVGPSGVQGIPGPAGEDGNTILTGEIPPASDVGVDGDFYYDTSTDMMYGPKAGGVWPPGASLVGDQGPQGEQGEQGIQGEQGAQGIQGNQGIPGPEGPQGDVGPAGLVEVYISDSPPPAPVHGQCWWESDTGIFYIWYNDGTSAQWVQAVAVPSVDGLVEKAGDTMTGPLILHADPTAALGAATKQYVDASGSGFNGKLTVSAAANALTIAVKTASGVDPSAASPVKFRVPTGGGGYTDRTITAALSITIPAGATMEVTAGFAFRVWIALFDDAGTPRLAVRTNAQFGVVGNTFITAPPEHLAGIGVAISAAADSAGLWYTDVAVSSKFWCYIGHATWETGGLVVPGNWAMPSQLSLLTPGSPRPGQIVQSRVNRNTVNPSSSTTTLTDSALAVGWNSLSAANFVEVGLPAGYSYMRTATAHQQTTVMLRRDSILITSSSTYTAATTDVIMPFSLQAFDFPGTIATVTYKFSYQNVQAALISYQARDLWVKEYMT